MRDLNTALPSMALLPCEVALALLRDVEPFPPPPSPNNRSDKTRAGLSPERSLECFDTEA